MYCEIVCVVVSSFFFYQYILIYLVTYFTFSSVVQYFLNSYHVILHVLFCNCCITFICFIVFFVRLRSFCYEIILQTANFPVHLFNFDVYFPFSEKIWNRIRLVIFNSSFYCSFAPDLKKDIHIIYIYLKILLSTCK